MSEDKEEDSNGEGEILDELRQNAEVAETSDNDPRPGKESGDSEG